MSDLISRSELLKEIEKYKFGAISNDAEREYIKKTILNFIICQPTAYSVDGVVEELEADSSVKLYGSQNSDNYMIPVKRAIEIVKQGGITDDVCEWKYNYSEYYFESSCDHLHIFMSDGPKENEYDFCPYCGKKIKVVE